MVAPLLRVGIREKKDIPTQYIIFGTNMNQTRHTHRFLQSFSGRLMLGPCFSQILGYGYGSASSPVIPHIQHQHPRLYLHDLSLCRICPCQIMYIPSFTPVLTIHNTSIRNTSRIYELNGKYQCAVLHGNTSPRPLK